MILVKNVESFDEERTRAGGRIEKLQGADATVIDADEAIIIQPPTAGGYGKPEG